MTAAYNMDCMADQLTHLSLFSGIGGLDLAAEWAGFQTVGQCEWADYPTKVLEKHWPEVPRWRDIRTLTKESFYERTGLRTAHIISGGFPCQPFSTAGKRRGSEDDRYLWPEMLRIIEEIRPTWVIGENVAGIINMALDTVLSELESQGYETRALVFPACAIDAPHRRDRLAIIGYSHDNHASTVGAFQSGEDPEPGRAGISPTGGKIVAHANGERQQGSQQHKALDQGGEKKPHFPACQCGEVATDTKSSKRLRSGAAAWDRRAEPGRCSRGTAQPVLGRGHDGLSYWLDGVRAGWADETWEAGIPRIATGVSDRVGRLKALGNAVVPAQFYPIFQAIADITPPAQQLGDRR